MSATNEYCIILVKYATANSDLFVLASSSSQVLIGTALPNSEFGDIMLIIWNQPLCSIYTQKLVNATNQSLSSSLSVLNIYKNNIA
jgi:hypothetical protein